MAVFQFYKEQKISASIDKVWDFISSPYNLKRITPEHMQFNITYRNLAAKIYPGMIIHYTVKPLLGLKMTWVTEITHVKEGEYFVDEQRVGPYKIWHHEHKLVEIEKGVLMTDLITYEPPFSILGKIANKLFIQRDLEKIFNYRTQSMIKIFGEYTK
ncbi:MAG: hypothetical protein D8M58_12145 [Calditrichaeota bacterium]|nr:MAG: hypothetical protein DWQ03_12930 [Calditrichota bacterium]MBL1206147.1 hypothetical protein [Calditrichota bacterium]NOG45972.1 SRPBCC family protein [Calditrichota bacterium]